MRKLASYYSGDPGRTVHVSNIKAAYGADKDTFARPNQKHETNHGDINITINR
jgi:hypothetical protein